MVTIGVNHVEVMKTNIFLLHVLAVFTFPVSRIDVLQHNKMSPATRNASVLLYITVLLYIPVLQVLIFRANKIYVFESAIK